MNVKPIIQRDRFIPAQLRQDDADPSKLTVQLRAKHVTVSMWLTADEALYQSSELDPSKHSKYASVMTGTMINIANDLPEGVVINFGSGNKEFGGSIGEKRKKEATTSHGSGEAQDVDDDDNRRQQQPKKKIKREDNRSSF